MNRRDFLVAGAAVTVPTWLGASLGASAAASVPGEWTPEQFHRARRFLDLPVGRIAYVERGRGPVALFLHGYPLNGFQWRGPMALLQDVRRCISPDLLGLGFTEVGADTSLTPNAQAQLVVDFMTKLGIASADFVANDSATGIAQLIAASHPERVRSMLLTNGDADTHSPPPLLMPFIEQCRTGEADAWFARHYEDGAWARAGNGLGQAYHDPVRSMSDPIIKTYFEPLLANAKRRAQARRYGTDMLPNPLPAITPQLRGYEGPARMVWARNLDIFPEALAVWLDRILPSSRGIRLVDNAKLFFPEEQPHVIAEEARRLWSAGPQPL